MTDQPQIKKLIANTVVIKDEDVTTVVALLDDGTVVYTGLAPNAEWHRLPPIPPFDELD